MQVTPNYKTARQTLMIDADDTLWENNIYFERAIAEFISFLNHRHMSPAEVRQKLNAVEHANILQHGYGLHSFTHALVATFEQLSREPLTPALRQTIHGIARTIAEQPIELLKHVGPTLKALRARHRLLLVTKGNPEEQSGKVERSGLKEFFEAVEVVAEKNRESYQELVARYALDPASTWMVGNSPKSDINPAIAAGLNAVFIPHADTWVLEHAELCTAQPPQRLLTLEQFHLLGEVF
ncbi:MAG: HAD family hydrolase [Acidobacteriota bacterium]|nr:HAD family hydrolase [Acidobacteriota bacterium]